MAPDKSLAAEIEAATERERARLVAWLAEHQVSTGNTIDREMTADALMADFIAPRLAEIDRLKDRLEIKWAYDGSGNRVPFPEGMEDCDGIACRDETIRGLEERLSARQSRAFEDGAQPKVLATGWLKSMGRRDGEDRGPVVELVIDASQQHAMTFGDIWNGKPHQIVAALAEQEKGDA